MILVVGSPEEGPVARVLAALERAGAVCALCDPSRPLRGGGLTGMDGRVDGWLTLADGDRIDLGSVRAVYARLLDHRRFPAYAGLGAADRIRADETQAVLTTFLDLTDALVVNRTAAMGSNRSKPYQIGLIRRMGFDVPPTLVTNDPGRARAFSHGTVA